MDKEGLDPFDELWKCLEGNGFEAAMPPSEEEVREAMGNAHMAEGQGQSTGPCSMSFTPARSFTGLKPGMIFKKGALGIGYYFDDPPKRGSLAVRAQENCRTAIPLVLDALIPRRRPNGRKRRSRRHTKSARATVTRAQIWDQRQKQWQTMALSGSQGRGVRAEELSEEGSLRQKNDGSDDEPPPSDAGSIAETGDTIMSLSDNNEPEVLSCSGSEEDEELQDEPGRSRGWWLFDTVNANSWGVDSVGGTGRGAADFLRRSSADVVAIQETKLSSGGARTSARCTARKAGWNLMAPLSGTTEKGYATAGVGIAARSHFGSRDVGESGQWEETVAHDATRIVHSHIGICCRGGVHCFSVYLHTVEGLTARNCETLSALGRMTMAVRWP